MSKIIFAHGFGVQKDDRGLFPDIAAHLPGHTCHMVDLNDVDQSTGNLVTPPLEEQARRLAQAVADKQPQILIAHSMGCLVACLAKGHMFDQVIFITPPLDVDLDRTIGAFKDRPGSVIDLKGTSVLMRRDGTQTIVPSEFWVSKQKHQPQDLYVAFKATQINVLIADQDEVLGQGAVAVLPNHFCIHRLPGDHNFSLPYRAGMLKLVANLIGGQAAGPAI